MESYNEGPGKSRHVPGGRFFESEDGAVGLCETTPARTGDFIRSSEYDIHRYFIRNRVFIPNGRTLSRRKIRYQPDDDEQANDDKKNGWIRRTNYEDGGEHQRWVEAASWDERKPACRKRCEKDGGRRQRGNEYGVQRGTRSDENLQRGIFPDGFYRRGQDSQ